MLAALNNIKYNDLSQKIVVRHIDGNKLNINPDNLAFGTTSENAIDCKWYSKSTKLKKNDVINIKTLLIVTDFSVQGSKGMFDKLLFRRYNVSVGAIRDIRLNVKHKEVEPQYGKTY